LLSSSTSSASVASQQLWLPTELVLLSGSGTARTHTTLKGALMHVDRNSKKISDTLGTDRGHIMDAFYLSMKIPLDGQHSIGIGNILHYGGNPGQFDESSNYIMEGIIYVKFIY
jgi:hypothetical protein